MKKLSKFLLFLFVIPICFSEGSLIIASAKAYDEFKAKSYFHKNPIREYSIILTPEGYYPNRIMAFEGEKVRFFVTSTEGSAGCFIVDDHKIFLSAKKGQVAEAEIEFKIAGKFKFFCPSSKHKGYITVLEKFNEEVIKKKTREIASERRPTYWLPKNYD